MGPVKSPSATPSPGASVPGHPARGKAAAESQIAEGADVIMLDNMTLPQLARAVRRVAGRAELEVSGGVTLERLPALAKLGVDYVSMGALTHSARAMDLSVEFLVQGAPPK